MTGRGQWARWPVPRSAPSKGWLLSAATHVLLYWVMYGIIH
jgi:hypothetical protein